VTDKRRYYKEMRVSQLRALIELDRNRGFSRAAAALQLTTPSVWQQIRALEADFGCSLVQVNGHDVTLTEEGQMLLMLIQPVVSGFDSLRSQFEEMKQSRGTRLTVAAPTDVLMNELPDVIRRYRKDCPDVAITVIDRSSAEARKLIEAGEVDLALAGNLGDPLAKTLSAESIMTFPFMLLCPKKHPLVHLKSVTAEAVAGYPIVMPTRGTNARRRTDDVFRSAGLTEQLQIALEASVKELLIRYVQMEFGIAIAPVSAGFTAANEGRLKAENLVLRNISDVFGEESLLLLRQQNRHEPEHVAQFRRLVVSMLKR